MGKGKGNKLLSIPSAKVQTREEYVRVLAVVPQGANVKILAGKRGMTLTAADLAHYQGERGRRGNKLPRGLQRVDGVEVETAIIQAKQIELNEENDGNSSSSLD